jgi:hypothetical protein
MNRGKLSISDTGKVWFSSKELVPRYPRWRVNVEAKNKKQSIVIIRKPRWKRLGV